MASFVCGLDRRLHRLDLGFQSCRTRIVCLSKGAELPRLRAKIGVDLLVALALGGADVLHLLFLGIGEIEVRAKLMEGAPVSVAMGRTVCGRLGESDRRRSRSRQCNEKLFHDVQVLRGCDSVHYYDEACEPLKRPQLPFDDNLRACRNPQMRRPRQESAYKTDG